MSRLRLRINQVSTESSHIFRLAFGELEELLLGNVSNGVIENTVAFSDGSIFLFINWTGQSRELKLLWFTLTVNQYLGNLEENPLTSIIISPESESLINSHFTVLKPSMGEQKMSEETEK